MKSVVEVAPIIKTTNNPTHTNHERILQPLPDHSKPQSWKIGNPIKQANQLVKTQDGRLLLVNNSTPLASPDMTCPIAN